MEKELTGAGVQVAPWRWKAALLVFAATWLVEWAEPSWMSLWPSIVALTIVFLTLRVMGGLLLGAAAGVVLINGGNPFRAFVSFFADHLIPSMQGDWRTSVIVFTFLLGGFAALLDYGGGIQALLHSMSRRGGKSTSRRVQVGAYALGLICFFDGLASCMLVGRSMRPLADRAGVSRAKLSYIVDTTSSAVACVAMVSTWIAYQLSMIEDGFAAAGQAVNSYLLFLQSLPYNFYSWFALLLLLIVIVRNWNFGPMRRAEAAVAAADVHTDFSVEVSPARAWIPLAVLIAGLLVGLYVDGAETVWPLSFQKISVAFGKADAAMVLVVTSALACIVAFLLNYRSPQGDREAVAVFMNGVSGLFVPVLILISAWVLSSTLQKLDAAGTLAMFMGDRVPVGCFPMLVFVVAMAVSFTTGTSWGTMGVITPLAIPLVLSLTVGMPPEAAHPVIAATVAATFGGAVFGDHCSPLSDTTIVSSIACGLETMDHVKTQLPYALLSAGVALIVGYGGVALGMAPWWSLAIGAVLLLVLPFLWRR